MSTTITNAAGITVTRPAIPERVDATMLATAIADYATARCRLLAARRERMADPRTVGGSRYRVPDFEQVRAEWTAAREAETTLGTIARCRHLQTGLVWKLADQLVAANAKYDFERLRTSCLKYLGAHDDRARPRDAKGRFVATCPACQGKDADHAPHCQGTQAAQAASEREAESRNASALAGER